MSLETSSRSISTSNQPPESSVRPFIQLAALWHVFVGVAALAGTYFVWQLSAESASWIRAALVGVLVLFGAASLAAVPYLRSMVHRGRFLSLAVNYLGFLAAFLGTLHFTGLFYDVDALAGTFGRGVPFLGLIMVGFVLDGMVQKRVEAGAAVGGFGRFGRITMYLGLALFLLAVGILPGILAWLSRLNNPLNIGLVLATLLFGSMALLMWRPAVAFFMGETSRDSETLNGYLFLSPNLLGFLLFFVGPLLFSLYVSFTDSDAFGQANWIGLSNYAEIFNLDLAALDSPDQAANEVLDITVYDEVQRVTLFGQSYVIGAQDKLFWIALGNTLKFVLLAVPLSIVPALLLASVLNSKIPGMTFFRTIYFLPSIAAVVGVALIWRWLYNSTVGWINYIISTAIGGINSLAGSEFLVDPQIGWLSDTNVALYAVVIIAAWQWLGFNTILYLAGLQNIPKSLYEAATVDGAGAVTQFFRITIPLLASTTFFVVTTTTIQAMQIFDQVFVLTSPSGGPGTSTTTIVLYLYNQGFRNFRQGYASALAWVLFLMIFGLTLIQFQRNRKEPGTA